MLSHPNQQRLNAARIALRQISDLRLTLTPQTLPPVEKATEEQGVEGAQIYAKEHANDLRNHAAALESDLGAGHPAGFRFGGNRSWRFGCARSRRFWSPSVQAPSPTRAKSEPTWSGSTKKASLDSAPRSGEKKEKFHQRKEQFLLFPPPRTA